MNSKTVVSKVSPGMRARASATLAGSARAILLLAALFTGAAPVLAATPSTDTTTVHAKKKAAPVPVKSARAGHLKRAKTTELGKTGVEPAVKSAAVTRKSAGARRTTVAAERRQGDLPRRVAYRTGHVRHAAVHRIAFAPSQPFHLHEDVDGPALRSSVAFVVDQKTSAPLFEKNSREIVPIASISKLMTAMVVLDSQAPLTDVIDVTDADRDYEKGTGSRLSVGSRLSREDMLHIALMASENRAAAALSRYFPGGRPAFIDAMNHKAQQLGMTDTHFIDPTGLTSQNVSSARDLVKMVNAAYQYPLIRRFSTDSSYDVNTGRRMLHYGSTNALVRSPLWEIGLQKTGFINEAGQCLVMQATIDSRPVVMVLLDSTGKYSRIGDAQRVRNWLLDGGMQRLTSAETNHAGT